MRRLSGIALLVGLLVAQGFDVTLAKEKTGNGQRRRSGSSPSGTSRAAGASSVGGSPSNAPSVGAPGATSRPASGSFESGGRSAGPAGPSNNNGPNTDQRSRRGFDGTIGGSFESGPQMGNGQLYGWFNGPDGGSQAYRGPFDSFDSYRGGFPLHSGFYGVGGGFDHPSVPTGFFEESRQGWFGSLGNNEGNDFGGPSYQGSQDGQGGPNVFGGPFGRDSSDGTSGFGSGFGGFQGPWNQGSPLGRWNFGDSNIPGGQDFLSESSSFGSGYLDALSGLSGFGSEGGYSGGVGLVRGSRRSPRLGKRLLALLPQRSRRAIRLYSRYKKSGGRGSFFYFLRKLRSGTLRGFGGRQADSFGGLFGSSSERYGNNFGQQVGNRPSLWSQASYGSSFGRGGGFGGASSNENDAFSP